MRKVIPIVTFKKDITTAELFGKIQAPIFTPKDSPFAIGQCKQKARERAQEYDKHDVLICDGPCILGALAIMEWMGVHNKVNVLVFHAREREYLLREVLP